MATGTAAGSGAVCQGFALVHAEVGGPHAEAARVRSQADVLAGVAEPDAAQRQLDEVVVGLLEPCRSRFITRSDSAAGWRPVSRSRAPAPRGGEPMASFQPLDVHGRRPLTRQSERHLAAPADGVARLVAHDRHASGRAPLRR